MSGRKLGRNARLTKKRFDGAAPRTSLWASVYGDSAGTAGSYFASLILHAPRGGDPVFVAPKSPEHAHAKIEEAILGLDSKFFRDVADYLDAKKTISKKGPADPVFAEVALFVCACVDSGFRAWAVRQPDLLNRRHIGAALRREPRTPAVSEIFDHVCEVLLDPPSYKTVERHAERLGITGRGK